MGKHGIVIKLKHSWCLEPGRTFASFQSGVAKHGKNFMAESYNKSKQGMRKGLDGCFKADAASEGSYPATTVSETRNLESVADFGLWHGQVLGSEQEISARN
jgi:hypothetical protein